MEWISINHEPPSALETVWACNNKTGFVALGCFTWYDGWLFAESNGIIYSKDGKIISECELNDEYDITHWMALPVLPLK